MTRTELINPATEQVLRTVQQFDVDAVDDAVKRAVVAQKAWAARPPADRAGARCGHSPPPSTRTWPIWPPWRWPIPGIRSVPPSGRPGTSVTCCSITQPPGTIVRQTDSRCRWPRCHVSRTNRRHRRDHPVELSDAHSILGLRPGAGRRQRGGTQTSQWTPLTSIRLGELAVEAGLPPDLFQVLPGKGSVVGQRFVTHPDVRKIVFTGSTEVGTQVMAAAAEQVKRVTLELGGKSANIVFDDCDLERAAATAPYRVFDNAGQDCCARSRILVQRSVFDRFMELLRARREGVCRRRRPGEPGDRNGSAGVAQALRVSCRLRSRRSAVAFRGAPRPALVTGSRRPS